MVERHVGGDKDDAGTGFRGLRCRGRDTAPIGQAQIARAAEIREDKHTEMTGRAVEVELPRRTADATLQAETAHAGAAPH